ncbi:aspartoacylase [Alteromonas sp. 5E99-2]|nr:aspartoacylase [Alteromonas sp. 5E99-2]
MNQCLIVGGTHGNEMSGLAVLTDTVRQGLVDKFPSINLQFDIGNPNAVTQNTRFTEEDLNRQFTLDNLNSEANTCYEAKRAREFDKKWGPKQEPTTDFVIDIHNTTSAMGPCLIILELDDFHIGLARYVKQAMPSAVILVEDEQPPASHPYLCTIGKRGVMVEVGAQPQGVCRAEISAQTIELTTHILAYCALYNAQPNCADTLAKTEAFRLTGTVYYPDNTENVSDLHQLRDWAIHSDLQDSDFTQLNKGDPIFVSLSGGVSLWEGETTYPHFINEAAYHKYNVAFATSDKFEV